MPTESAMLNNRSMPSKANREDVDLTSSRGRHEALVEALEIRS
jgi:hypothetical protein